MQKPLLLSCAVVLFLGSIAYCQDSQSLGDIARQLRADKQKGATVTGTVPTGTATHPAIVPSATGSTPVNASAPHTSPQPSAAENNAAGVVKSRKEALNQPSAIPVGGSLKFFEQNEEFIRELFEENKFEDIDTIADDARSTKRRFDGGFWSIHAVYAGLQQPRRGAFEAGEVEWRQHLDRLKLWVAQHPNSVTARIALACSYEEYAWNARGRGYANTVTEEQWKLFHERVELAGRTLAAAFALPTKDPEWYLEMQFVVRDLGGSKEMQQAALEKALAFEPDYYYYYQVQALSMEEQWGGDKDDVARFAQEAADRVGGEKGDIIYYEIASFVNCNCGNEQTLRGLSFPRIKRGYIALENKYRASLFNLNKICYMAAVGGDPLYANELFGRIQENWDPNTWKSRTYFENARDWAKAWVETKLIQDAIKAADDDAKSPKGQSFNEQVKKFFSLTYGSAITNCVKQSGAPFVVPFDLVVRVGKDGALEKIYNAIETNVSACLTPQIQQTHFPVPPEPSYWVKIHVEPSREQVHKIKAANSIR